MEIAKILLSKFFLNEEECAEVINYIDNVFDKVVNENNFGIFFNKNNKVEDIFDLIYDKFLMEITPTLDDITIVKRKIGEYSLFSEHEEWSDKGVKFNTITDYSVLDAVKDYLKEKIENNLK